MRSRLLERGNHWQLLFVYVTVGSNVTYATKKSTMKSKLTLRLDHDLKERAKRLARERGTSVSKIVENYFRLLLEEGAELEEPPDAGATPEDEADPDALPPRTRRMLRELRPAGEALDLSADTRTWIDAARRKHE